MPTSPPAELLSTHQLARRLDIDPRALTKAISRGAIVPDYIRGTEKFFHVNRIPQLGDAIRNRPRALAA